jgi:hypothetical protein
LLIKFIQSGNNNIQRLAKASLKATAREHTQGAILKAARQSILDMGQRAA